jgi:hypothetical protein
LCALPVLSKGCAGEFLKHQAGEEQQRAAWSVVHNGVLGLRGGVAGNHDDNADVLAANLNGALTGRRRHVIRDTAVDLGFTPTLLSPDVRRDTLAICARRPILLPCNGGSR